MRKERAGWAGVIYSAKKTILMQGVVRQQWLLARTVREQVKLHSEKE